MFEMKERKYSLFLLLWWIRKLSFV
jgi:hypothetical protein